jgi:hypothetical protein
VHSFPLLSASIRVNPHPKICADVGDQADGGGFVAGRRRRNSSFSSSLRLVSDILAQKVVEALLLGC